MKFNTVKFSFLKKNFDKKIFSNIVKNSLNISFDENYKPYTNSNKKFYEFKDLSGENDEIIRNEIDSFFKFNFDNCFHICLYKFLVIKTKENYIILSCINSLIFDYITMNKLFNLIDDSDEPISENNLEYYYNELNSYLCSNDFENDRIYWQEQFQGIEEYLNFFNIQSDNYESEKIRINFDNLNFSNRFNFMTAVFSIYLSRINKSKGCLLKTNVENKTDVLGPFDKNILLKIDYEKDKSFKNYLNTVESVIDESIKHTKVNIENYIEDLSFYSIYDFSKYKNTVIYNGNGSALTLNIYNDYLELIYNSDLFSDVYIRHMLENIKTLIYNIIDSPNQFLNEISILSNNEEKLLFDYCKGNSVQIDEHKIFSKGFREHAINNPDDIAIDDGTNQISYGDLEKSTNSIAYDLKNNYNIGSGDIVALMFKRNYHFPELVLALNKIGAAFVPIDPIYPIELIELMLDISEAKYIITTNELSDLHNLSHEFIKNIYFENLNRELDIDINIVDENNNLFAVMFTSGTTGIPKGVTISNKQCIGCATSFREIFDFSNGDTVGSFLSFTFVASFVMYSALYFGACCKIFNETEQHDSLLLIKTLQEKPMNSLMLPPMLGLPIFENHDLQLKYLVLSGDKLSELNRTDSFTKVVNFYGTTEIISGISKIYDANDIANEYLTIGKPVSNTWVYILDDDGNQMPIGVTGEICVSGKYISSGYFKNSDLTNEVFVDNPHSYCDDNKVMYRTGDLGFFNFNGEIEFIGRLDDQLSVRGFRVEPDEILNIMKNFNEINDVYLDVDYDTLIAYYTTNNYLDIDNVKNVFKSKLPYYMIPSLFIEVEMIPLNPNGKVDKFALRNLFKEKSEISIADDILSTVVDAFKTILTTDNILIDDNFVSLGGNSLSAMKLQILLNEKLNIYLSSSEIIELSTPANISNHIKSYLNTQKSFETKYTFDELCPLSESQLNIYLDETTDNLGTAYNNPFEIKFKKKYSVDFIKNIINKYLDKYPILSARIILKEGNIYFSYDSRPEIDVNIKKEFVRPFDLNKNLAHFSIVENDKTVTLYIDLHHLIFDVNSLKILLGNLPDILDDSKEFEIDNGVLRQISFEENILNSDYTKKAGDFFDLMLSDCSEVLPLMPSLSDENGKIKYQLPLDSDKFETFLRNHSLTYNQFFTSVFAYTMSRFTGSSKVLFYLIEDGRGHIDLTNSPGMFVRTLPLIIDCKNQSVTSFLKYSSQLVTSAMKYDLYPFRILANKYELNPNILFEYIPDYFEYNNKFSIEELEHDKTFDLFFSVIHSSSNEFSIKASFSSKFSKNFIKSFIEVYNKIILDIMDAELLSDIDYISVDDLEFLDNLNQTGADIEYEDILDAFNDNLAKNPNNNLVSYEDINYTYSEGAFIASLIADQLKNSDVSSGDCVSFLVSRSHWYLLIILGIMSNGSVFVPLDPSHPDERLKFMVEDTSSKVIIVDDDTYERGAKLFSDLTLLNVSQFNKTGNLSKLPVSYNDLACILYTSGTTGLPKGVKNTRKSILNVCAFYTDKYNLNNDDVYGLFSAIGFDVSIFVINVVIYAGACLSVVPEEIRLDMHKLNEYFINQSVSHAFITTQVAKLFMNSVDCSYLKVLLVIGEKLGEVESPEEYLLVDAYGPTEAFAFVTAIENNKKIDYSSVGLMNYNMKSYVLDDELRQVPIGGVGELYLSGEQLADGYLNRKKETSNAFIHNSIDEGIMYRTGDIVRILPDGSIGFISRRDGQVKIRGNRLELGEVETIIRQLDYVEDVTVQTVKHGENNELIAYIVCSKEYNDCIKDYISQNKPDYMIPSHIINLDKIPLNVNGKVDKKALKDFELNNLKSEYVAPKTDLEKIIVDAFENAFDMTKISLEDDFVKLGGDSLIAIKLISHLNEYNVSAADIMSLKTPKAIADNIKENKFDLNIYTLENGCPLNEPQMNIYLDIRMKKEVDSYFIPFITKIPEELSESEIIDVLNKIFERHPICYMCVSDEFEIPYLIKSRTPSISVEYDVDDVSIYNFLAEPFDVHDSLCRFLIVKNDEEYLLYSVFHHLIFDERSIHVFRDDFYHIINGDTVEFDESFLHVSAFNSQIKNTQEYNDAHDFYNSMLCDAEGVSGLLEDVLPDGPDFASCDLNFDKKLFDEFLKKNSISEYVLFTSVFAYTFSRFTGSSKVLFNIDEHGRDRFDNFDSIGMFVNTLPLLVDTKDTKISSFVKKMADLIYNVLRYNYYPYRNLAIEHDIHSEILFQYFPIWLNKDDLFYNVDNKIIKNINDFNTDLMINVNQKPEGYTLNVQYSSKYSKQTIKRFMDSYNLILTQMLTLDKLSDINYINDSDLNLLNEYNKRDAKIEYEDILDAFNDNLTKYPDKNLVSYNNISYTYAESAFIASEIARYLADANIESGDFVPFLVPRSHWYMLVYLGILSIGAIYVPLDDLHPDDRLKFILKDIDSKVLVVTDESYARANDLSDDLIIINVSDIVKRKIGTLNYLKYEHNDLASVFYTSGSTGIPKGVLGTRKAIVNLCQYYADNYNFTGSDIYGLYTSIGFDVSIFVMSVVMYAGACLSVIPEDSRLNMNKLNEYFINQKVTHSFITTQVGKLFIESVDKCSLNVLFVIGEKLGLIESPENYQLIDAYGPTETFNFVSAINNNEKIDSSSVGYLSYNMKYYVLDEELRHVPIGAVGELYLSGNQIAKGYLNSEKETSISFLDNPFDEGMMYRTGDMVRVLPDGSIGIIGRRDGQVKIRGNRVELGEVESVIRELNYIQDVTIQTIKNGDNNELIAYVVNKNDVPIVKSVKDHIKERKPEYMVPSFVIELDEIPLNVNGKVDKKTLPDVNFNNLHSKYVAPVSETEKIIVSAFENVFNTDKIGIYDDFIELGGDSLTAIKITSLLSKNNIEFNARDIKLERTPYRIAQIIDYSDCDNSCRMIKKGDKNQNMFLIPPMTGFSFEYSNLVHSFDFKGNVYAIDDPKFKLSLDEIKKLENPGKYTLDKFYEMIKDIFKDGDILVGYSSGGIFSLLLAEKLQKNKKIGKCIIIDGLLNFNQVLYTRSQFYNDALAHWKHHEFDFIVGTERKGLKFEKFVEITLLNVNNNFDEPRLNCHILYLSTGELFSKKEIKEKLDSISPDNEIKLIDSTNHSDILKVDYNKLIPFFK